MTPRSRTTTGIVYTHWNRNKEKIYPIKAIVVRNTNLITSTMARKFKEFMGCITPWAILLTLMDL